MTSLKFKTNVKCNGCKAAITPFLDNEPSIDDWRIDLFDPEHILVVEGDTVTEEIVVALLTRAGYKAELLK